CGVSGSTGDIVVAPAMTSPSEVGGVETVSGIERVRTRHRSHYLLSKARRVESNTVRVPRCIWRDNGVRTVRFCGVALKLSEHAVVLKRPGICRAVPESRWCSGVSKRIHNRSGCRGQRCRSCRWSGAEVSVIPIWKVPENPISCAIRQHERIDGFPNACDLTVEESKKEGFVFYD